MHMTAVHPPSFIFRDGDTTQFWKPQRGGEYEVQCARGRGYAQELLDHMRAEDNPLLFGSVMRAIQVDGKYEGVEIGFFSRLGIELLGLVA